MWACRIQGKNSWNVVTVWTVHTLQIPASKKEVVGEGIRATNVTNLLWSRLKLIKIMLHFPTWLEEKKRDPDYLEQCRGVTGLGLWFAHKHQQRRLSSTSLETSGDRLIFISHHQDYQFFQKDPSTGLTQQVPVQQSLAVFILGMGTGMTYFLERLVWASMAGTGGGGHKRAGGQDWQGTLHIHPYQSPVFNYYADGMDSNFILAVAGFSPGSTLLPKRLWFS